MSAAPKSKSSCGKSAAVAETEESTKESQDPSLTSPHSGVKSSTFGRLFLIAQIFIGLVTGAILGAYLAAHILESEYQNIVANLQSDHHSSLLHTQNDYIKCQSHLTVEQRLNEEEMTKLKIHADQNERAFQRRVEESVNETNMAFKVSNEGLEQASSRLKMEVVERISTQFQLSQTLRRLKMEEDKHESTQLQLSQTMYSLKTEEDKYESTQLQLSQTRYNLKTEKGQHEATQLELSHVNKRVHAIRNTLTETTRSLEVARASRNRMEEKLQLSERELHEAEGELDRRDVERAECDNHHREMLKCDETLKEALANPAGDNVSEFLIKERETMQETKTELAEVSAEREELAQQVQWLTEEEKERNAVLTEIEFKSKEVERQRDVWEIKAKSMIEKISFRNGKEVLERFGPGPHYVRLNLAFPSPPANESILLELATLGSMPHTIHTFLNMIQENTMAGGTFILSRDHIVVGGPVDAHNAENNRRLEEQMVYEGYFPNGALLFTEYTSDFPHVPYTVGFNHVGGPIFYFNVEDNTEMHGPQVSEEEGNKEGDPCFAKIVEGIDVVQRIAQMPKTASDSLESPVYIVDSQVVNTTVSLTH